MDGLIRVLLKKFKGELSSEEEQQLRAATPEERDALKTYEHIWERTARYREGQPTDRVDANWQRFQARLAEEETPAAAVRPLYRRRRILGIAASIAALLALAWWLFPGQQTVPANTLVEVNTDDNARTLRLPDGSIVDLFPHSSLYYPAKMQTNRELELKGKARFSVQHDPKRPFRVFTGHTRVEVLGTRFLLDASQPQVQTSVQVEEGTVRFEDIQTGSSLTLTQNQGAVCQAGGRLFREDEQLQLKVQNQEAFFLLRGESLLTLKAAVENRTDYKLMFDKSLENCSLTGLFKIDSAQVLSEELSRFARFKATLDPNGNIKLSGNCSK